MPLDTQIEDAKVQPYNNEKLAELFTRLEFKKFLKELPQISGEEATPIKKEEFSDGEYINVTGADELKKLLVAKNTVAYLIDKDAANITFCFGDRVCYSADINNETLPVWREFFEDETREKIAHNLKDDIVYLDKFKIFPQGVKTDTQIGAYLIEPSRKTYDISDLCFDFLGVDLGEGEDSGVQLSLDMLSGGGAMIKRKAMMLPALAEYEKVELEKRGETSLFNDIEMPLVSVLASMQIEGFKVDRDRLKEFGEALSENIDRLTGEIYSLAQEEFNINSTKQLGEILFDKLGLPVVKKTKTGYSTNADVLEKLKDKHPIINLITEYRSLTKLRSTYVDGLIGVINEETGKIHSSFNQTVTVTGRISSTEPNLQNIPVRTELGREMRKMFIAKDDDHVLIDADYSQIELRVLAHIADDENMIDAFKGGFDIHASTAAKVFGVPKEEVTSEMRSAAKAINFGLVYGMGEFSLAQDLKISVKAAKEYINDYLGSYPKVQAYMKDTVLFAKKNGYVKTMFGRRREIPEIASSNFQLRSFGERVALNTPIQGSAADIIKLAMVRVYESLKERNLRSKLILQVHDELIIEAHKDEVSQVSDILKYEMENVLKLSVPLAVDMNTGKSWYDTK